MSLKQFLPSRVGARERFFYLAQLAANDFASTIPVSGGVCRVLLQLCNTRLEPFDSLRQRRGFTLFGMALFTPRRRLRLEDR